MELSQRAGQLRDVLVQFFGIPGMLNAGRFIVLYKKAHYWLMLRNDDLEKAMRRRDREDLLVLAGRLSSSDAVQVYGEMQPWSKRTSFLPREDPEFRQAFVDKIANVLRPSVEEAFLVFLKSEGSLRKLAEEGKHLTFKALLFAECSHNESHIRNHFVDFLIGAGRLSTEVAGVEALQDLLLEALTYKARDIGSDEPKAFPQG